MDQPAYDFLVLLNDLARIIRTEADKRARLHGLTRAQWVILSRVNQTPGLSQRALAEILEVEPITVGRLVDRLENCGLVERRPDPIDRRIWRLHMCPAGIPALEKLSVQRDEILALVTEGIDPATLAQVSTALNRMKTNIAACRRTLRPDDEKQTA